MVAMNAKDPNHEKLMAMLRRESLTLTVEKNERLIEPTMRPTVFKPGSVAVHKV